MSYGKLVRDLIPAIIKSTGKTPIVRTLDGPGYEKELRRKLQEEVEEYLVSKNPEELADIMEVVYAMGRHAGLTPKALEALRSQKAKERGGFAQKIYLADVKD